MRISPLLIAALITVAACGTSGGSPATEVEARGDSARDVSSTAAELGEATLTIPSVSWPTATEQTASTTTTTATVVVSATDAVELADSFYEAANRGDIELASTFAELTHTRRTAIAGLDARFWWRCESDDGRTVRCDEAIRDSFYGPAGLYHEGTIEYDVEDGRLTPVSGDCLAGEARDEYLEFGLSFDRWLGQTHPDISGWRWLPDRNDPDFDLRLPCGRYFGLSPRAAEHAAEYIGEFVESSPSYPVQIVLHRDGSILRGSRLGRVLFEVERGTGAWGELTLTRQPFGTLSEIGWRGTVWQVHELAPGSERRSGRYLQVEIHRLWPEGETDVLWLTDYSGATRDQLTGYPPDEGHDFTLFDALTLRGALDRFGLHADCRVGGDIAGALVSFEGESPEVLAAWAVDTDARQLVEMDDLDQVEFGHCIDPRPRG